MVGVAKTDTNRRWVISGRWRVIANMCGVAMLPPGMPVVMPMMVLVVVTPLVMALVTAMPPLFAVATMRATTPG